MGFVVKTSCNFPNAIKDPVKVTEPTIVAKQTEARTKVVWVDPLWNTSSYIATIALAAPPKALKTATSWGIAVICTYLDNIIPIEDPIINPRIIHSRLVSVYFKTVTMIAINIAIEESLLPFLAVAGDANLLIPNINMDADIR